MSAMPRTSSTLVPINDDKTENEVALRSFDPQSYICGEVWATISQVDDVRNLLRAVSRTQEEKLTKSLGTNKYQY